MSQFSEKCKELIEKNDTNVYRMLLFTVSQNLSSGKLKKLFFV